MKLIKLIMVAAFGLGLSACQTTSEGLQESGAVKMTNSEVTALHSGKTVQFRSGKGAGFYSSNGSFPYVYNGKNGEGKWSVNEDGTMCLMVGEWWGDKNYCNWEYFKQDGIMTVVDLKKGKSNLVDLESYSDGNTLK